MVLNDPLANILSQASSYEKVGKRELVTKSNSKLIREVLRIMQEEGYIQSFEVVEDGRGNSLKVQLKGTINKCGVIKPRFKVQVANYEKFEKRFLPAMDFGILIVSTNKGLMTNKKAKENNVGGALVAFVY